MTAVVAAVSTVRQVVPREVRELAAVLATATAHLAWPLTDLSRALLVVPLVIGWALHVWITARRDPDALDHWGLRRAGLGPTAAACAALIAIAGPAMVAWGLAHGADPSPGMLVAIVCYPAWGLVQQLLVQGVVTGGVSRLPGRLGHPAVATGVSATSFSLAHWPEPMLMAGTLLLGLVLAPIWLRWRNLWPLAFAHGWLGTALYYFVMMRDPMAGYFGG